MMISQLDEVHNWLYKLPQKSMDGKLSPSVTQISPLSFISHKMASLAFRGKQFSKDAIELERIHLKPLNGRPMIVESGFPLTLNFATLN
jgi:hypothetical protein